jgi:hypothetical protein
MTRIFTVSETPLGILSPENGEFSVNVRTDPKSSMFLPKHIELLVKRLDGLLKYLVSADRDSCPGERYRDRRRYTDTKKWRTVVL